MGRYEIINHAMTDGVLYSIDELSTLVNFNVTMRSINALLNRGLVYEKKEKYATTQADLFSTTQTAERIRA